jgi:hypothetical protein
MIQKLPIISWYLRLRKKSKLIRVAEDCLTVGSGLLLVRDLPINKNNMINVPIDSEDVYQAFQKFLLDEGVDDDTCGNSATTLFDILFNRNVRLETKKNTFVIWIKTFYSLIMLVSSRDNFYD